MGTTESVPEDGGEVPPGGRSSGSTHPHGSQRDPHRPIISSNGPPRQHSSPQQPAESLQRQRRPPPPKPVLRLEGLIVGGPKTGKCSLLQRLEGKNPFKKDENDEGPESKSSSSAQSSSSSSVVIPFKPPPQSLSPNRIQLYIQGLSSSQHVEDFYKQQQQQQQQQSPFVVILISPKHKLETTQAYLARLLTLHLDAMGYPVASTASEKDGGSSSDQQHSPICICILLNFRDLLPQDVSQSRQQQTQELESTVQEMFNERRVPHNKVVLDWIQVSLKNCYGLDLLHSFIYKTYLLRKEHLLEQQLQAVQEQRNGLPRTVDQTSSSYQEFVQALEPAPTSPARTAIQTTKPELSQNQPEQASAESSVEAEQQQPGRPAPRRTFQAPSKNTNNDAVLKPEKQSYGIGKDALEAFLASSDEEEEVPPPSRRKFNNSDSSSSDDDDDDFFYDETGHQRFNHLRQPSSAYESSDSSGHEKTQHNQPLTKASVNPSATKKSPDADEDSNQPNLPGRDSNSDSHQPTQQQNTSLDTSSHPETPPEVNKEETQIRDNPTAPSSIVVGDLKKQTSVETSAEDDDFHDSATKGAFRPPTDADDQGEAKIDAEPEVVGQQKSEGGNDPPSIGDGDKVEDSRSLNPSENGEDEYNGVIPPNTNIDEDDNDDDGYMIASTPGGTIEKEDDSDDDDNFVIEQTLPSIVADGNDRDDEEDYVIGDVPESITSSAQQQDDQSQDQSEDGNDQVVAVPYAGVRPHGSQKKEDSLQSPLNGSSVTSPSSKLGSSSALSEAAMAAVVAAQREAELMLQQQRDGYSQPGVLEKKRSKEKKSKKKKEGKTGEKKKKKKKERLEGE